VDPPGEWAPSVASVVEEVSGLQVQSVSQSALGPYVVDLL
jgi:hypothetical protein